MRIIFFAILLSLSAGSVHGHQCVLSGTGASEIAIYNACKNDFVMGMDGHGSSTTSAASATDQVSQKLSLLEAENRQLQAKLALLRNRLLDLMKDL
jgi:hypothetical protein